MSKKSKEIELKYSAPENTPVSKKGYFVTPLDNDWVLERNAVNSKVSDTIGYVPILGMVGTFFGSAIGACIDGGEAIGLIWGASVGGTLAVGSIFTLVIPAIFKRKKNDKAMDYAIEVNGKIIQDWLLKKYNLSINSANANLLSAWTSSLNRGHKSEHFTDSKGNKYKLDYIVVDGFNEFFVVPVSVDDTAALKPQNDVLALNTATTVASTAENTSQQETVFTGEAATLYSSIVTRVQKLSSMNVSVEKQHIIEFITKELGDVVQLHQKALLLTNDKKTLPRVISVLSNLNDELDKLILAELADVETQLLVKENHLNSRKQENIEPIRAVESLAEEERANV